MKNQILSFPAILSASGALDVEATISHAADVILALSAKLEARAEKRESALTQAAVRLTPEEKAVIRAERDSVAMQQKKLQREETKSASTHAIAQAVAEVVQTLAETGVKAKTPEVVAAVCELLGTTPRSREGNTHMVVSYLRDHASAPESSEGWHITKGPGGGFFAHTAKSASACADVSAEVVVPQGDSEVSQA